MHSIDQSKLSNLINLKHDKLVNWILNQIGAGFVLDLQESRFDVKKKAFEGLQKPLRKLHEIVFEKNQITEKLDSSEESIEKQESIITLLEQSILAKNTNITELKAFKPTLITEELKAKTSEELDTEKTEIITENVSNDTKIGALDLELNQLEITNKVFEDRIVEIKSDITLEDANIKSLARDIQESVKVSTELSNKLLNTNNEYLSSEKAKVSTIQDQIAKLSAEQNTFTNQCSDIEKEIVIAKNLKVNEAITKLETILAQKNDDITNKNLQKNANESVIKVNEDSIKSYEEAFNDPNCPKCKQSMSSADHLKEEIAKLKRANQEKESENLSIVETTTALIKDKTETEASIKKLRDHIANASSTIIDYIKNNDSELIQKWKSKSIEIANCKTSIDKLSKDINEINVSITKTANDIANGIFSEELKVLRKPILEKIEIEKTNKSNLDQKILTTNEKLTKLRKDVDETNLKIVDKSSILLKIETLKSSKLRNDHRISSIENDKVTLSNYLKDKITIDKNEEIIKTLSAEIIDSGEKLRKSKETKDEYKSLIDTAKTKLTYIDEEIENAKKWHVATLTFNVYNKIVGGSVLQNTLFSKLSSILNSDLDNLLSSVNFKIGFDKSTHNFIFIDKIGGNTKRPISQISGMEETFSALALISVIKKRKIKQNVNFLFIDEITGKLNDGNEISDLDKNAKNYQEIMGQMIMKMAELTSSKLLIIDHVIDSHVFDNRIVIRKNEKGIAELIKIE